MQKESKYIEILVSKIIFGILTIYVLYWIAFIITTLGEFAIESFKNELYFDGVFSTIVFLTILVIQIIILAKIFLVKTPKYWFTNFERQFHPFFKDENNEIILVQYMVTGILLAISHFVMPYIFQHIYSDSELPFETMKKIANVFVAGIAHWGIFGAISARNETLDKLPIKLMKTNNIRLKLDYEDYINKRIYDDEPHLLINQSFELKIKNFPRNESEKNTIEIRNNNAPNNSALIARIEDRGLANAIRNGDVIKSRLVSIGEFTKLEIEISID